jgi:hypothetical protein
MRGVQGVEHRLPSEYRRGTRDKAAILTAVKGCAIVYRIPNMLFYPR